MKRHAERQALTVLYEDEALIAFDKPAGVLAAPGRWDKGTESLIQRVHRTLSPAIFSVHRLDRETSGVLLCAKTRSALRAVCRALEGQSVRKEYAALVRGVPPWEETAVNLELERDPQHPGRMRVQPGGGKPAETRFRVIEAWRRYALLEAVPLTGRTHQIRVHSAAAGFPIVADRLYGDGRGIFLSELKPNYKRKAEPERPLIGRAALHAACLILRHPVSGEEIAIRAPYPRDFEIAIRYLRRFGV